MKAARLSILLATSGMQCLIGGPRGAGDHDKEQSQLMMYNLPLAFNYRQITSCANHSLRVNGNEVSIVEAIGVRGARRINEIPRGAT